MVALADMVDVLLLIDRDEAALTGAAQNLPLGDQRAVLEPFVLSLIHIYSIYGLVR